MSTLKQSILLNYIFSSIPENEQKELIDRIEEHIDEIKEEIFDAIKYGDLREGNYKNCIKQIFDK